MSHHDETTEYPRPGRADDAAARRTGWHPVNTGHLVMGVAFAGLVIVWALVTSDTVEVERTGWVMGVPWLVAGAVGLIASALRGRRREEVGEQSWEQGGWDGHRMRGWQ